MNKIEISVLLIGSFACGVLGGIGGGYSVAKGAIAAAFNTAAGERAEAQVTFSAKDEITVEYPSIVRGRAVRCTVVASAARRVSSVMC